MFPNATHLVVGVLQPSGVFPPLDSTLFSRTIVGVPVSPHLLKTACDSLCGTETPSEAKFCQFCCFSGFALYWVNTCNKCVFAQEVEGQRVPVIAALGILLNLFGFFLTKKISKLFVFVPNSIFILAVNYSCLSIWNQQMFSMSQQLPSNFALIN